MEEEAIVAFIDNLIEEKFKQAKKDSAFEIQNVVDRLVISVQPSYNTNGFDVIVTDELTGYQRIHPAG